MAPLKNELNPSTGLPDEFGHRRPLDYFRVLESERAVRIKESDDLCVIDEKLFLVRAHLPIMVIDDPVPFGWGLWAQVSETDFRRYVSLWDVDGSKEPPMAGLLSAEFKQYMPLYRHPVDLFLGRADKRPRIRLRPSSNRMYREQEEGITAARRYELFRELMPWLFS
jgi:hypothetical protein